MKKYIDLYKSTTSIIILAILGALIGYFIPQVSYYTNPFGTLFITLLKMLIIPVIFITVLHSIISIKSESKIFKLAGTTFTTFFIFSFTAGMLGVFLALYFGLGYGVVDLPANFFDYQDNNYQALHHGNLSFWGFIFNVIPTNIFIALQEGKLISIVIFSVVLGIGILSSKNEHKNYAVNVIAVLNDALMIVISKIMYLAPIATFSLMLYFTSTVGLDILFLAGKLMGTVIFAQLIWVYVILGLVVAIFTRAKYFDYIKKIIPLQMISFATASSLVSVPHNMEACDKLGVKKHVSRFVLPLGANLHMNGSAIFYGVTTVFFAHMFDVPLAISDYIVIALVATIGSMATPGVPGLSLTIVMVMLAVNVPIVGLPLIFAIDRVLDYFTTTVNVVGDTVASLVADKVIDEN